MAKVTCEKDGRIARITLNRPEVMNAIDDDLPLELEACVEEANADPQVHTIVLSGAGKAFCAGYDLAYYAEAASGRGHDMTQGMPWDPMKDYAFMMKNTERFMSLWRSHKPVIAKVHGFAVAGGSDIALCCGPGRHGRKRADRLHAGACVGLPDDGDVGLQGRCRAGQAHAVYRRQNRRAGGGTHRPRPQGGARRGARRGSGSARRTGSPACRSTS